MEKVTASNLFLALKKNRLFWIIPLVILILGAIILAALYLLEPTSAVKNLFITNKTDHQATISWTTDKDTQGSVLISEDKNFPLLPLWSKNLYKEGEPKAAYSTTHYINIGNLQPNKIYQFKVYQGLKEVYKGNFFTGSTLTSLPNPDPVYGRVLKADGKTPVTSAIVYFQVKDASGSSALLSTVTNTEGRWTIDLGNLRTSNYRKAFSMGKKTSELLVVEAGNLGRVRSGALAGLDKPWPDIILSKLTAKK